INKEKIELIDNYIGLLDYYDGKSLNITVSLYFISEVKSKTNFDRI
ncbi:bifunctional folylpolyglutamate synthase/dihydrofolate synthase, partial [Staphylococcus warneri]